MARFSFEESENYGGGSNKFFTLKDDKDTAVIRFLYNNMNDIQGVSVHTVKVDNNNVDVECLRAYNEPVEKCPLCAAGQHPFGKLYIPVYDEASKESKIWTRGRTFFNKLSSLCSRYNPLVGTPIEVERNGKKGDQSTTYEMYPMQSDNAIITDFPEINAEGLAFHVKTEDELNYYLDHGTFPKEQNNQVARGTRQAGNSQAVERRAQRETPAQPVRRRPTYNNDEESF